MFDDPKKDLKWLEEQLLAVDAPQEEDLGLEDWLDEEDSLEAELREARALMGDGPGHHCSQTDVFTFLEEDAQEEDAPAVYADAPREERKKKEKGVGGLVFLACLETLGILAVLAWWAIWLL